MSIDVRLAVFSYDPCCCVIEQGQTAEKAFI